MDNLVLTRISVELAPRLTGADFAELRQESRDRFRIIFTGRGEDLHVIVSLNPELPWIGRPARRWAGPRWSPDPFAVATARALEGRKVAGLSKPSADRALRLDLGDGCGLVLELATHGANLVLLAAGGIVEAALRHPKRSRERLEPGRRWQPRGVPEGKLDPFVATAEEIDAFLAHRAGAGEDVFEALRRDVFGVGSSGSMLVLDESAATGRSPGTALRARLDAIVGGDAEVVIEGPEDAAQAMEQGRFDPARYRLLPWRPHAPGGGSVLIARADAAATAGLFYEAGETADRLRERIAALGGILRRELRRTREAGAKVRASQTAFEDPERHRRLGEALLAGLAVAKRDGETVLVPDPYDEQGGSIAIPAPAGRPLTQVADDLFQKQRRARRGLAAAGERLEGLERRAGRLEDLLAQQERTAREEDAAALESAMRAEKLAVGLAVGSRAAREASALTLPKLEGVRMVSSPEGWTILVGRTGRDNDRLTFKFAAPDDIWLHAQGAAGAHVVIRNPDRRRDVPEATLAQAARLAAWFSDARAQGVVDVQWSRRKNVRRARGGTSGAVVVKRFQTLRVRAAPPPEED